MRTIKLTEETRKDLLEKLLKRSPNCYGEYEGRVTEIVNRSGQRATSRCTTTPSVSTGQRSRWRTSV